MPSISRRVGEALGHPVVPSQPRTHAPAGTTALGRPALACWCGESLRLSDRAKLPPAVPLASIVLPSQHPPVPLRPAPRRSRKNISPSTPPSPTIPSLIVQRQGRDYIGLLETPRTLGTVSAKAERPSLAPALQQHSRRVSPSTRPAPASRDAMPTSPPSSSLENGRGLVPLASLNSLLPRFLSWSRKICTRSLPVSLSQTWPPTSPPRSPRMTLLTWFFNSPHPSIPLSPTGAWQTAPDFQP